MDANSHLPSQATRVELLRTEPGVTSTYESSTPGCVIAVFKLGHPVTYNRKAGQQYDLPKNFGIEMNLQKPLIIVDDILSVSLNRNKSSHTKTMSAAIKGSINYLSKDGPLPGDWVMVWMVRDHTQIPQLIERIQSNQEVNKVEDGLKFLGRIQDCRKQGSVAANGTRSVTYRISAVGFGELDTIFFYDMALASTAAVSNFSKFIAEIGLDYTSLIEQEMAKVGEIKDNIGMLMEELINIIVGEGVPDEVVNRSLREHQERTGVGAGVSQVYTGTTKEAPYAYLIPTSIGKCMGVDSFGKTKGGGEIYGYADILHTLIGVQYYAPQENYSEAFLPYPLLKVSGRRSQCSYPLKGTFIPVNPFFVNVPLWSLLESFLNRPINEMYTCLKPTPDGHIMPHLIVRQLPFTSESLEAVSDFPVTRFMNLPRWVIPPIMVRMFDIGRSDATRTNMVHLYGEARDYETNRHIQTQMVLHAPIVDTIDAQRSGMRTLMRSIRCTPKEQTRENGIGQWMRVVADHVMGSHLTLNGQIVCSGIQSPIAEGDNIEFEGVVYHIEGINDSFVVSPDGRARTWNTTLYVCNGMPADQSQATVHHPVYPGFKDLSIGQVEKKVKTVKDSVEVETISLVDVTESKGDSSFATSQDPGETIESVYHHHHNHGGHHE